MQLPSENVKDIYIGQKCLYKKEKLYLCIKKVLKKK